jgi:dihydrofolate synthase / folylpolyglutamate synthase
MSAEHQAALDFLLSRIDYERVPILPYNRQALRLDRMRALLRLLGDPQAGLRIVHLAGTKGKGSTAAMVASALTAAGLRTGLFSSPHLDRLEERMRIDGREIESGRFIDVVHAVRQAAAELEGSPRTVEEAGAPTFFELTTAMALVHFARQRVDAAVLEVGLGGRLDSTNVCHPLVSVITSISLDHMRQLGDTVEAIAGEKAGIVKPGVPCISGVTEPGPARVIVDACRRQGARLVALGSEFGYAYDPPRGLEEAEHPAHLDYWRNTSAGRTSLDRVALRLLGEHQAHNAAVALATIDELNAQGWSIPESAVRRGLAEVRWPARVEVVARRPTVVLDAAHNVASIEALVRTLDESFAVQRRRLLFATKDIEGMLRVLGAKFDEILLTRYEINPRGVPVEELAAAAARVAPPGICRTCPTPAEAWEALDRVTSPRDLVCISGSFFIAAEVRALLALRGTPGGGRASALDGSWA